MERSTSNFDKDIREKKAFYMLMKVVAWFENKHNKSLIF